MLVDWKVLSTIPIMMLWYPIDKNAYHDILRMPYHDILKLSSSSSSSPPNIYIGACIHTYVPTYRHTYVRTYRTYVHTDRNHTSIDPSAKWVSVRPERHVTQTRSAATWSATWRTPKRAWRMTSAKSNRRRKGWGAEGWEKEPMWMAYVNGLCE